MTLDEKIASIESDLTKLKDKSKDKWDKFSLASSALIPLAIAAVGGFYTYWSENTKTELAKIQFVTNQENKKAEAEQAKLHADGESKIKQAELVSKFFDALTGPDDKKREFAVNSLLVAAPDYGPILVRVVAQTAATPKAANYATSALDQRRDLLIRQMFGEDADQRKDAYGQLMASWSSDISLIDALISYSTENIKNTNGVFNSVVLLSHMQKDTIVKNEKEILAFAKLAEANGPKTAERVIILRSRVVE